MGLFMSLKGNHPETIGGPSPSQGQSSNSSTSEKHFHRATANSGAYAPESSTQAQNAALSASAPSSDPPSYHDWTVIPDTALLPPPPAVGHEQPLRNNADPNAADSAHSWCRVNPLVFPHQPTSEQLVAIENGNVRLMKPVEYRGDLSMPRTGSWKGSTRAGMKDACLLTSSPLYFASAESPIHTGRCKTIYFEVEILSMGYAGHNDESTLALGFCAMPYPTWRMPGWERASLAVHSDDGHRYVNDPWGGKDFTAPFKTGDTVGIGMKFSVPQAPPEYNNTAPESTLLRNNVEIFFTRNGKTDGSWDLHEELDRETDQGVEGLDGLFDLYGAIGVFSGIDFTIKFKRDEWLWRPR